MNLNFKNITSGQIVNYALGVTIFIATLISIIYFTIVGQSHNLWTTYQETGWLVFVFLIITLLFSAIYLLMLYLHYRLDSFPFFSYFRLICFILIFLVTANLTIFILFEILMNNSLSGIEAGFEQFQLLLLIAETIYLYAMIYFSELIYVSKGS